MQKRKKKEREKKGIGYTALPTKLHQCSWVFVDPHGGVEAAWFINACCELVLPLLHCEVIQSEELVTLETPLIKVVESIIV